jgi:hypothetical protein
VAVLQRRAVVGVEDEPAVLEVLQGDRRDRPEVVVTEVRRGAAEQCDDAERPVEGDPPDVGPDEAGVDVSAGDREHRGRGVDADVRGVLGNSGWESPRSTGQLEDTVVPCVVADARRLPVVLEVPAVDEVIHRREVVERHVPGQVEHRLHHGRTVHTGRMAPGLKPFSGSGSGGAGTASDLQTEGVSGLWTTYASRPSWEVSGRTATRGRRVGAR